MANNIPAFKNEFFNLLSQTVNLDAETKQNLRNYFVSEYEWEWNERVASGTNDTAANRARFAIDKIVDGIKAVYRAGSRRENEAALPPVKELE